MADMHDANQMNSYDHLKGTPQKAHMGSQSHLGSTGGPTQPSTSGLGTSGAVEHNPGGATPGKIGSGGKNNMGM